MIKYSEKTDAHIYVTGGAVTKDDWAEVIKACMDQQKAAPDVDPCATPVERNADGDTLEEIKAVYNRFQPMGYMAVMCIMPNGEPCGGAADGRFALPASRYHIAAKHANAFDPKRMDKITWAIAVFKRGLICKRICCGNEPPMDEPYICKDIDEVRRISRSDYCSDCRWTAIPRPAPDVGKLAQATEEYLAGISIAEPRDNMPEPKVRTATLDGYRETAKRIGKRHAPDAGKAAPQADDAGEGGNKYTIGSPYLHYTCDFAVYPSCKGASICYCTDLVRAQMVVDALNHK